MAVSLSLPFEDQQQLQLEIAGTQTRQTGVDNPGSILRYSTKGK